MWHCFIDGLTDTRINMDLLTVGVDMRYIYIFTLNLDQFIEEPDLVRLLSGVVCIAYL